MDLDIITLIVQTISVLLVAIGLFYAGRQIHFTSSLSDLK